jgi:uncharacterized membrane protein
MAVGAALCGLATWRPIRSVLIGWDVTVGLYLAMAQERMARSGARDIRRHAAEQDEGRFAMLILTVTAGLASLAAIVAELGASEGRKPGQTTRRREVWLSRARTRSPTTGTSPTSRSWSA